MMFYRGSFFLRLLAFLLLTALLVGAGSVLYRAGFTQGYAQGSLLSPDAEQPGLPRLPYYPGWGYPHFGFFPFFPLAGLFLLTLLFFGLIAGLFRRGPWGGHHWGYHHGGHHPGEHPHWHGPDHPHPWDREGVPGKPGMPGMPETPAAGSPESPSAAPKDNG